jgi:hypothetical protein
VRISLREHFGRNDGPATRPGTGNTSRTISDSEAAVILVTCALTEIRYLAWRYLSGDEQQSIDCMEHIHFLSDLVHNLPEIAHEVVRARSRDRREMQWAWSTAGPDGQAWILNTIEASGCLWIPPPPPAPPLRSIPHLPVWREAMAWVDWWPVRTPIGRVPLPPEAHVLKALGSHEVISLHEEAGRQRFGLGADSRWLKAHLDPDGMHYLTPDPALYYWPDRNNMRWWQCRELLRMADGMQVTSSVAVIPERFAALPDNLSQRQQRRLVYIIRAAQYDLHLWGLDHRTECNSGRCGYVAG